MSILLSIEIALTFTLAFPVALNGLSLLQPADQNLSLRLKTLPDNPVFLRELKLCNLEARSSILAVSIYIMFQSAPRLLE